MRQQKLADGSFEEFREKPRKELHLDDMDRIIPWQVLHAIQGTSDVSSFRAKRSGDPE